MEKDEVWAHIHAERRALAEQLAMLSPEQWAHETLCSAWSVHDVAAHVISHPQLRWRHLPGMVGRNLRHPGYNAMLAAEVKRWAGQRSREQVLAEFEEYDGSTDHAPLTTPREALIDVLVHTQDILRPLGRRHEMPPAAAAVAASRALRLGGFIGWRTADRLRLEATDVDWSPGHGPDVRGPMQELLLLIVGRTPDATLLAGEGLSRVKTA